jgi:hypothetical protein
MNLKTLAAASAVTLCSTLACACEFSSAADTSTVQLAQAGGPSGRGSVTGDPAASSATPGSATTGSTAKSNPSGSGTSTSGGRDDNGDQGRDRMPDSNNSNNSNNSVMPNKHPDKH